MKHKSLFLKGIFGVNSVSVMGQAKDSKKVQLNCQIWSEIVDHLLKITYNLLKERPLGHDSCTRLMS